MVRTRRGLQPGLGGWWSNALQEADGKFIGTVARRMLEFAMRWESGLISKPRRRQEVRRSLASARCEIGDAKRFRSFFRPRS